MSLALVLLATIAALLGVGMARKWYDELVTKEALKEALTEARERSERRRQEAAEERQLSAAHAVVRAHRHAIEVTAAASRKAPARALEALLPRVYEDGEEPTLVSRRN